jgi:hypothetical protein
MWVTGQVVNCLDGRSLISSMKRLSMTVAPLRIAGTITCR